VVSQAWKWELLTVVARDVWTATDDEDPDEYHYGDGLQSFRAMPFQRWVEICIHFCLSRFHIVASFAFLVFRFWLIPQFLWDGGFKCRSGFSFTSVLRRFEF
jgi:hypothetical protein